VLQLAVEPDKGEVRIRDSGIDKSRDELSQMFEPFRQGDGALQGAGERRASGLGLGLAIARSLVERHGGRIRAESGGRGLGTEMIVTLPLATEPAKQAFAEGEGAGETSALSERFPSGTQRVLLVEDHAPTQRSMAALLKQRGFTVEVAGTVEEARQRAGEMAFDLLISDLGLPDGSGHSLMAELKQNHPDLAGIAISGYGMDADVAASRAAGFTEHLVKPTGVTALERAMQRALRPRDASESARGDAGGKG
jgi:CheY-like chemotaxis protein